MPGGYTRPSGAAPPRTVRGRHAAATPMTRREAHVNGRKPRVRALLSVANRDGIAALARDLRALDVEIFATDGTREYLAQRRASRSRPSPT